MGGHQDATDPRATGKRRRAEPAGVGLVEIAPVGDGDQRSSLRGRLAPRRLLGLSFGWCASELFRGLRPGVRRRLPEKPAGAIERPLGELSYTLAGSALAFQRFKRPAWPRAARTPGRRVREPVTAAAGTGAWPAPPLELKISYSQPCDGSTGSHTPLWPSVRGASRK